MFLRILLCTLTSLVLSTTAWSHGHTAAGEIPLKTWHLSKHRHIHASFLMIKGDSVYLESEQGAVKAFPIGDFSAADRQWLRQKSETIKTLNRELFFTTPAPLREGPENPWLFSWFIGALALVLAALTVSWWRRPKLRLGLMALGGALFLWSFQTGALFGTDPLFIDAAFQPFKPNVATRWDADWFYVESKGIPTTHSMMTGITKWQQQVPLPQCYIGANAWQIPLNPVPAATPVPVNPQHFLRGAVAIAANGIPIFNPYTNTGVDALVDGQLDQWGGHSGRADDYHYHIAPLHLDAQTPEILPIAFALDGFAVYGSLEPDGKPMLALDANHGHFDTKGIYHYHGTPEAPYMIGNMVGKVTEDATLQIVPQSRATPVRPSLTPLTGATITDFQPNGAGNGYKLTYARNGQNTVVDYSWTPTGVYTYRFIGPTGTTTETYNGFKPCEIVTAVEDAAGASPALQVFPNPTTGHCTLRLEGAEPVQWQDVTLFDAQGKTVLQVSKPGNYLEMNNLSKGVYLAKVRWEKGEMVRKIVVQ